MGKFFDGSVFLVIYDNFIFMCYVNILWVFEYVIFKSFNGYIILVNNMYYLIVIIGYNNVFFGVKIDINWIC